MPDMALCASTSCTVCTRCKRHSDCPDAYPAKAENQSYAIWYPTAGPQCPGFIDHKKDWREV
jgi:hypothetical protein